MAIKTEYYCDIAIKTIQIKTATIQQAANLKQALEYDMNHKIGKFIIDLSGCEFFDSTFLGVLVVTLKKVRKTGGDLKIIKANSISQLLLQRIGGSKIFDMFDTVEEALKSFDNINTPQPLYPINYVSAQSMYNNNSFGV